jgi:N-acetyl sugar amidotransferase
MSGEGHRICGRCVIDTTDPNVAFDEQGLCNHCRAAEVLLRQPPSGSPPAEKARLLEGLIQRIRDDGTGRRYDCVIGVSGGVDSTYVALLTKKLGLRALAVHLDNGWDSELAVANIENVLKRLNIDLYTYVINWEEFKDLQLAFLKASTPDSEIPTDHAIVSVLYHVALREGVRAVVAGGNYSTESIMPRAWSQGHGDWRYIKAVHRRFGTVSLRTYPHRTLAQDIYYRFVRRIRWVSILDYVDYVKKDATAALTREAGWRDYGGKHFESIYTRFYQAYILPTKFGYDKRKAHLSGLIMSGQMTRAQALAELAKPPYDPERLAEDREYVINKFGLLAGEFDRIMALPPMRFEDYPSYEKTWRFRLLRGTYYRYKRWRGLP